MFSISLKKLIHISLLAQLAGYLISPYTSQAAVVIYGPDDQPHSKLTSYYLDWEAPPAEREFHKKARALFSTAKPFARTYSDFGKSRITAEDVDRANLETFTPKGFHAYWVPDTWLQLLQIEEHFLPTLPKPKDGLEKTNRLEEDSARLVQKELLAQGLSLKDLENPALDYATLTDRIVERIQNRIAPPLDRTLSEEAKTALPQLATGRALLVKTVQIENENRNESLIWRFTEGSIKRDGTYSLESIHTPDFRFTNKRDLSFAYSLLSGFVVDGYKYSKLEYGKPTSACTFCYWIVHQEAKGVYGTVPEDEMRSLVGGSFFKNLKNHALYALKIPKEASPDLQKRLLLPMTYFGAGSRSQVYTDGSFHHQACYGDGEEFHPRIDVKGLRPEELAELDEILRRAILVYHGRD